VGQSIAGGADERVVLFLQLAPGHTLEEGLIKSVKTAIRQACVHVFFLFCLCLVAPADIQDRGSRSPRHVPEIVLQVEDVPHTINNKKGALSSVTNCDLEEDMCADYCTYSKTVEVAVRLKVLASDS
jgi:hypothetical protein